MMVTLTVCSLSGLMGGVKGFGGLAIVPHPVSTASPDGWEAANGNLAG